MTLFLDHFPKLNFFLPEYPALLRTTSYGFLALCQNFEKADTIPRKRSERQQNRRMDARTEGRTE